MLLSNCDVLKPIATTYIIDIDIKKHLTCKNSGMWDKIKFPGNVSWDIR